MLPMFKSISDKALIGLFGLFCFGSAFYALGTLDFTTRVLCIVGIIGIVAAKQLVTE